MLEHGGLLRAAARRYRIPVNDWQDLSTGINPNGWPVPAIPADCWQRLPEKEDALLPAAQAYYQNDDILPVAGSQAAIQTLPWLRRHSRVGVLRPAYAEHAENWNKAGHDVIELNPEEIEPSLPTLDVLIVVNPNNPTGQHFSPDQLLIWHRSLQERRGWLLIDEAFIDCRPQDSLSSYPAREGLIILRSLGKFFGLAGIRCGFVIADPSLLLRLEDDLGPWSISHPARYVATQALQDSAWQRHSRTTLPSQAHRLRRLLASYGLAPVGGCDLFQWVKTPRAAELHHLLAQQAILTRLFRHPCSLRFGLPGNEPAWHALERALAFCCSR